MGTGLEGRAGSAETSLIEESFRLFPCLYSESRASGIPGFQVGGVISYVFLSFVHTSC